MVQNIDGLPISKSSSSQLYPILCIINYVRATNNIFVIGIYHGYDKPSNFNVFLEDFVNESISLTLNGLILNGKPVSFKMSMFLLDAVAKASVLGIKGHNGYFSCSKWTQEGEYYRDRRCFPDLQFIKRTDLDFINQSDKGHHVTRTILENILNIGLVTDIVLDYMHLVCLGVTKKLLVSTWCFGPPPHKLSVKTVHEASLLFLTLLPFIPCEFARKPRLLKECKRFRPLSSGNFFCTLVQLL